MPETQAYPDGQLSWSAGVNSIKVTTIASEKNPGGMARDELCWLDNGRVRDGGITNRSGWILTGTIHDGSALFQGKYMYHPTGANPYEIHSIGGRIYKVDCETFAVTDLSAIFGLTNPATEPFANFVQGEEFLVIQAGDLGNGDTLPLFWDGTTLRRSLGLPGFELPAATAMEYYMGRIWYAQGRQYTAGDIVQGSSGTAPYDFRDSILKVTENPLAIGGDGFVVPTQDGNIRALKAGGAIDAALGQGRLFVFTRKAVYALQVPVTRADWIAANSNNQPLQTVVQLINGSVNDRSIVAVNGDLYYQSLEPGIRSLMQSVRYFNQPGNRQISANEQRILQFNDRSLMRGSTGMLFDNRMYQSALPKQAPQGIVHQALIPMDFIPISSFGLDREPVWEGMNEGVDILQLAVGDFGGRERAFAAVVSRDSSEIQLWEITNTSKTDKVDGEEGNRTLMIIEFPAMTWAGSIGELEMKKLVAAEFNVDRVFGTVNFFLQWRPDSAACWLDWAQWKICSPRNVNETTTETVLNPISYPLPECLEGYKANMVTPKPPEKCASIMGRPAYIGYQMQARLIVKGFVRIRAFILHAEKFMRPLYQTITCTNEEMPPL
jgi:hypothetical protein